MPNAPRHPGAVRRVRTIAVALPLLVALSSCGDRPQAAPGSGAGGGAQPIEVDPTALTYAPDLGVDFSEMERLPSGLFIRDDVVGEGQEAVRGRVAVVHYTGYHPDGRSFDSSRDRNEPFSVVLGIGQVIQGWDQGIPGMRVGGRRTLVIPPQLAYGAEGAGGGIIPPNAVLVFEVELLAVP